MKEAVFTVLNMKMVQFFFVLIPLQAGLAVLRTKQ